MIINNFELKQRKGETENTYRLYEKMASKIVSVSPDQRGSVGWASSHKAKGHGFNSWAGRTRGLWACPRLGRVQEANN